MWSLQQPSRRGQQSFLKKEATLSPWKSLLGQGLGGTEGKLSEDQIPEKPHSL